MPEAPVGMEGILESDGTPALPSSYTLRSGGPNAVAAVLTGPCTLPIPYASESRSLKKQHREQTLIAFLTHRLSRLWREQEVPGGGGLPASPALPLYDVLHIYRL